MTDSSSLATSEFLVWIVLNGTDQAQCTVQTPVLPSIKYIILQEVTCSSTMIHSLFSTLITRGHDMRCKMTGCKIRSCSEREVSKLNITVDVTIVTDLNDTFSLFKIQGTGPGLWEAFHGFTITHLHLIVWDDETIGVQDVLFSQLLSSQTQLETLYMDVSKESLGLCKALNGLNIKILHLTVLKDDVIINHIELFSETLKSLTQLEQLYILVHNDNAALWKAIHGLNITILSLAGVVKGFTVIHVESLSETLTSLKQLKQLSIEFYDDSPGLWKAFHGLNINRLSLVCLGKGFTVIHAKHLSETLSSLKQLEEVSIEVDNDSPGLWEALYGLNIKSLSLSNIESITSKLVESLTQKFHQHLQYLNLVVIINQRSLLEALGHLSVLRSWDRVRRSFASEYLTVKYVECLSKTLTSLKQLEQLSIIVDDGSPALWDALYGLNIKRLGLGIARIRMPLNQSLSKTLTSLRQLEHLSIIANEDGPALWDALYGLNVNSLILSGEEKNLIHIESLSESLTSFTQLKYLSILVIDDSPGLWTALNGLNIKSLELSFYRNDFIVKHGEFLSKTLTSFAQLEELLIEVYDDSPGLWEALYGMNIKSLSLTCVGKSNIVSDVESMSETLTSLTQLEILRIEVDDDSPGLWEALNGMNIKSLSLKGVKKGLTVNHAQSLSETLTSLTQLENISVTLDNESSGLLEALYGLTIERLGLIWVGKVFISSNEESLSETLISLTRLENLSIEVDDDCPGLWKALYGLNIKNLRLRSERKGLTVSNVESLSESLKSLKQLDKITIEMKSDSPGLWEALYGLNTKRLCLSGCSGGLEVNHAEEMSQSLASLTHLESLSIDFNKDSICLWEALKDLTIKRLRLCYISGGSQVIHAEALSQSLSSLKHLDMLGIGLNVENPGLWEALHGLNINSLCLNLRFCLTGLEVQNMSQFLSSLTHLETLRIEANCDSPDLWEAFRGLQIKNLHIGTELGCFEVDHVSSLVMSLSSLNQMEHISINLENDLPGLWEVLFGLQIKSMKMYMNLNIEDLQPTTPNAICINMEYYTSGVVEAPYSLNVKSLSLRLIGGWENLKVYQTSRLTQMLSSLTALEMLSITADMDSVALWESLHALNVKNLSLSGRHGGLKVNYAALLSQSLSSITQLETFNITVDDDIPGLLEALRGLKIKRLKLILGHESSLSKSLASLTQLERLTMRMKLYSDIHLTQSLQYLEFYYERLSPRELRELLNKVFELNHKVQCRLEFGCSRIIEEYLTIKQELDAQAHVEVDWFRAHARTRDTNTNNVEYNISMGLLINRVKDPASTTSILAL